jgi:hypothetical protein
MICAYGPYAASATGGNGWARDFLAGVLTVPATPFYTNIGGKRHLEIASTILFGISLVLVAAVYAVYFYGPTLRKRSPFAESLAAATTEDHGRQRVSRMPSDEDGLGKFQGRRTLQEQGWWGLRLERGGNGVLGFHGYNGLEFLLIAREQLVEWDTLGPFFLLSISRVLVEDGRASHGQGQGVAVKKDRNRTDSNVGRQIRT